MAMTSGDLALGIDIGTSGVRTAIIDHQGKSISSARAAHSENCNEDANAWWDAVSRALYAQVAKLKSSGIDPTMIKGLAVDGTSGSMVLVDQNLNPVTPALMYNTSGFASEAEHIAKFAEPGSITLGASSALARMLHLQLIDKSGSGVRLLHQADFIAAKLAGKSVGSDDNNALKLGWDPQSRSWPSWFDQAGVRTSCLPHVAVVGSVVGTVGPELAQEYALSQTVSIHAGTTDSIAAFLASGANKVGDAVTSLGTTLAIKMLSDQRIDDASRGVYSHRLGDQWLAGGASNTGGGVLAAHFSGQELSRLSKEINPELASGLDYYPLNKAGERFPINDLDLQPRMTPRPDSDAQFLHGLLEGIARIEAQGYQELIKLGAVEPKRIYTAGGGAKNPKWSAIRERFLSAPLVQADEAEASVGVARLCL